MTFITKTVRLVAPPEPPFIGTRIKVRIPGIPDADLTYGIAVVGSSTKRVIVDWGDGNVEEYETLQKHIHEYPQAGVYEIRIAEGISTLLLTFGYVDYQTKYGPCVLSLVSNDAALKTLGANSCYGCVNLAELDLRHTSLERLGASDFQNCASLQGELYFPSVIGISGKVGTLPFEGCTGGLTKIHFAKANEESITASASYKADPTLGSQTAVCVFDL